MVAVWPCWRRSLYAAGRVGLGSCNLWLQGKRTAHRGGAVGAALVKEGVALDAEDAAFDLCVLALDDVGFQGCGFGPLVSVLF